MGYPTEKPSNYGKVSLNTNQSRVEGSRKFLPFRVIFLVGRGLFLLINLDHITWVMICFASSVGLREYKMNHKMLQKSRQLDTDTSRIKTHYHPSQPLTFKYRYTDTNFTYETLASPVMKSSSHCPRKSLF